MMKMKTPHKIKQNTKCNIIGYIFLPHRKIYLTFAKTSKMAAAQAAFEFPLISLTARQQLLVLTYKNNLTYQCYTKLFILCLAKDAQIENNIIIPKTKFIEITLSAPNALTKFNWVFNKETNGKYYHHSLREKMIKALDISGMLCTTKKEIIDHLSWLTTNSSVMLLNVQDFATLFQNPNIPIEMPERIENTTLIKLLYNTSETLYNTILTTNMAINKFLNNQTEFTILQLFGTISDLKMKIDTENTARKYAFHLFDATLTTPHQLPTLRKLVLDLRRYLGGLETRKLKASGHDQYHFLLRNVLPHLESQLESMHSGLDNRIFTMQICYNEGEFLSKFCDTLMTDFESQLYTSSSEKKGRKFTPFKSIQ